mmetsp:Transcript_22619/g.40485  ORF Transcript_22619/g.40485 Transcript_22619/m.40485 type:complete len:124 (-) Transcript_22619:368-739(-)
MVIQLHHDVRSETVSHKNHFYFFPPIYMADVINICKSERNSPDRVIPSCANSERKRVAFNNMASDTKSLISPEPRNNATTMISTADIFFYFHHHHPSWHHSVLFFSFIVSNNSGIIMKYVRVQ